MAELPLIATKNTARRQGHARILVGCFEQLLKDVSGLVGWGGLGLLQAPGLLAGLTTAPITVVLQSTAVLHPCWSGHTQQRLSPRPAREPTHAARAVPPTPAGGRAHAGAAGGTRDCGDLEERLQLCGHAGGRCQVRVVVKHLVAVNSCGDLLRFPFCPHPTSCLPTQLARQQHSYLSVPRLTSPRPTSSVAPFQAGQAAAAHPHLPGHRGAVQAL